MNEEVTLFSDLGLSLPVLHALSKKGFEAPTPIQALMIPKILKEDTHIIGKAQTGTGKTMAFGIPLVEKADPKLSEVQALILTPTRELAMQVSKEINFLRSHKKLGITPIYGGQSLDEQIIRLSQKTTHIVVGTPGRILDHLERGTLSLHALQSVVLDEADEMFSMGFVDDIEAILAQTPSKKRVFLFSATMPDGLSPIIQKHLPQHEKVSVADGEQLSSENVEQTYMEVPFSNRLDALCRIIDTEEGFYGIVFCRTRIEVVDLQNNLTQRGFRAEGLHGDISQAQRERSLERFKKKKSNILVATDVAARGIDIEYITHVINYSLPRSPEAYVHRVGRTGRAGSRGIAITFVDSIEYRKLFVIKHKTKTDIHRSFLPKPEEIVNAKIKRIRKSLDSIISHDDHQIYMRLAHDFLAAKEPVTMIAAILRHAFEDQLDQAHYPFIDSAVENEQGPFDGESLNLFFGMGLEHGMSEARVRGMIALPVGLPEESVHAIKLFDKYSFFSMSLDEGFLVLEHFESQGGRPLVRLAFRKDKSHRPRR